MKKTLLALACLVAPVTLAFGQEPGSPFCFGEACPCENNDPNAGCMNSTGQGCLLTGSGTASISADDLTLQGSQMNNNNVGIVVLGTASTSGVFLQDGLLCLGGNVGRLWVHKNTGSTGTLQFDNIVGQMLTQGKSVTAGDTYHFQLWYRDTPQSQCGQAHKANTSNGYSVTFSA